MADVHDVAAAVVGRLGEMTAMKLEKLVYYCQGWHLAVHGTPLFDEPIEAWREGPVVPALYRRHKGRLRVADWPSGRPERLDDDARSSIDWVVAKYGNFSAVELSEMTHHELPWRAARVGIPDSDPSTTEISRDILRTYYGRQRVEPETAVALATANAALKGVEFDEKWQDRLRDVATGVLTADDLIRAEICATRGGKVSVLEPVVRRI